MEESWPYGWGVGDGVGACGGDEARYPAPSGTGGAALCVSAFHAGHQAGYRDYAGQILLFGAPVSGTVRVEDARARYLGDEYQRAQQFDGERDLDGDGTRDLVIGAFEYPDAVGAPGLGRVAVVLNPPDGVHRLWDIADELECTAEDDPTGSDAFGMALDAGDLDGDGLADLVVGAPRDPTMGEDAGSVTLLYGASLSL